MMNQEIPVYLNADIELSIRVEDLLNRMTVSEKISQMLHQSPPIPRLGVAGYNWWNECLHGVGRAGDATVFPQSIGMAATWNPGLVYQVATAISDEARAKFNQAGKVASHKWYQGLTFWSPNVNIFRDPRWGRGQETYGEDPCLTSQFGVNFIKGLQGSHPQYLKVAAGVKHYAVHSGPEAERHGFNAQVSLRDLRTTYLPAFEAAVVEADVESVMGAYNRTNGEACCASETLLQKILREEWGFEGHVVSDCGAISDIYKHHEVTETAAQAASLAVKNGCDLNCGETYQFLLNAYHQGLITEEIINRSVRRLLRTRIKLGMFDSFERVPYNFIPPTLVDCSAHQQLALETARESMVLLKNEGLMPVDRNTITSVAVIGPKADDELVLRGNYYGDPVEAFSIFRGIQVRAGEDVEVKFAAGCDLLSESQEGFSEATDLANEADFVVMVLGLSQLFEGEEGQQEGNQPGEHSFGDRTSLDLPGQQENLLKAVAATGKPIVLVLLNGSALAINWAQEHVDAILEAWYPGQAGGLAVGDILFGDYNPSGRLPVTFYQSEKDLPDFREYAMDERTYRYFNGKPLYPFGYGLSYSQFEYSLLRVSNPMICVGEELTVSVCVKNVSDIEGWDVVQVYLTDIEASVPVPNVSLIGFEKVYLEPGEEKTLSFLIEEKHLVCYDDQGYGFVEPGKFKVTVNSHAPVKAASAPLQTGLEICFEVVEDLVEEKFDLAFEDGYKVKNLPYLFYEPENSNQEEIPLIVFLHGMGERGDDLVTSRIHGLPKELEHGLELPSYVVSPQCPRMTTWIDLTRELDCLISTLVANYPIDENRIYITGLSMGGYGTWKMLVEYPDRFAAGAPICGGLRDALYDPDILKRIVKIPIWNFHGDADSVVSIDSSDYLVTKLEELGGKIRYTRYPDVDHDSWSETYAATGFYQWLLSKSK